MAEPLFGIETEYAFSALDARGARVNQAHALDGLMRNARRRLPHLPDELSHGLFLQNGARFYVDCGGHPELTTPECGNPWDVVRYIRAGESILQRLAEGEGAPGSAARVRFFRCNVDYSGSCSTWGSHESYMHRADPAVVQRHLLPHLASRLVYTGAGGFRNDRAGVEFTLSPRAAHVYTQSDSRSNRTLVHDKHEDLCGGGHHRFHVVCGESLCSELATWLRMGTTALVVAMCDAGLGPGDGVALQDPVEAMALFAGDPSCRATVPTVSGRRTTAIGIQRHYLAEAEAHLGDPFMPPWAAEVCGRWRDVLDRLDRGWETAATTLDWAIKLALYRDCVRRRGLTWDALGPWSRVAERLSAALAEKRQPARPLRADAVLGKRSRIAPVVEELTPLIGEWGLDWSGLGGFLETRDALFEIDTRFGQLGEQGIFAALDAAGVLDHHVDGVDRIDHAIEEPPLVPRARLRGELVRELSGKDGRYCCSWDGVWDCATGTCVDLSDPFVAVREWREWSGDGEAEPPAMFLTSWENRAIMAGAGLRHVTTGDPIALSDTARRHRMRGELDEAEALFRRAIEIEDARVPASSPKRPHRRNHLSMVLMRAGKLDEARRVNVEAWRLKTGRHDLVSGRILFVRVALHFLEGDRDVGLYIGQLKALFQRDPLGCRGDIAVTWEVPDVLVMLRERLADADAGMLAALSATLDDRANLPALDAFEAWKAAPPVPLEAPWPER